MDDWDLFAQIRPPTPPPAKPRRTRVVSVAKPEANLSPAVKNDNDNDDDESSGVGTNGFDRATEDDPRMAKLSNGAKNDGDEDDDDANLEEEPDSNAASSPSARASSSTAAPRVSAYVRPRPATIVINGRVQRIVEDRPSIKRLTDLPPEILEQIYRRLDGEGVACLALSCKRLYDVSFTDCVWSDRIEREYGLKPECYRGVGISARAFYQQILFRYGWSLGCWIRVVKNYGGLLKVGVENGMIVGKEVVPPENPNVELNVTFKDIFCVKMDSKGRAKLICLREQFNNDESAVRRRRRVYSTGQQSSSEEDMEEEKKKSEESNGNWDLFANINSDGVVWEEEEKRKKEEEEAKKKKEEEKKAEEEERKKKGVVHGVDVQYVKEAHRRRKSSSTSAPSNDEHFHLECLCPQTHKQDFEDFRQEDNTFRFLAMTKYDTIRSYGAKFTYQKFIVKPDYVFDVAPKKAGLPISVGDNAESAKGPAIVPSVDDDSVDSPGFFPLKPGIFKGTYGGHGIEFVSIEKKSPYQFEAVKISGDPNVPYGKVTFCGDLRDFLFPSEEDQLSLDKLKPMEPERQVDPTIYRTLQPYRSPPDCFVRSPFPLPDKCRARFKAECQVSEWGYTAPQFIKAHLVVFSQDFLALIILDIKSVVLFQRLPFSELGLPEAPVKIFRPVAVPEEAAAEGGNAAEVQGVVEPPPKPRRAVFRWPPPKFGEALGDVDT